MSHILIVYPNNFFLRNMGTNNRIFNICKELHRFGHKIDLLAFTNFCDDFKNFDKLNSDNIINKLYLSDFKFSVKIVNRLKKLIGYKPLGSWVTLELKKIFRNAIQENKYNYILFVYPYSVDLLADIKNDNIIKIFLMEDFISINQYMQNRKKDLGRMLNDEINRLKYFEKIVCVSMEEMQFFQKLLPQKQFIWLPYYLPENINFEQEKEYDLIFIGHDNPDNIQGLKFFLDNIYPKIIRPIKIAICGRVSEYVAENIPFIEKYGYVEDVTVYLKKSKISICPLQTGTGMKVKVIESMSYGIPIVCTTRGVDGFPDRYNNGCLISDSPIEFAHYINLLLSDQQFYADTKSKIINYFNSNFSEDANRNKLINVFK